MSYLGPLRLHFAGRFQAAISTVNNDPLHYDNAAFRPQYKEVQSGNDPDQLNGWFNPRGSGDWRLIGCNVTAAWVDDHPVEEDDPVLGCVVADSDRSAPAKLVDMDPEQQMVSTIWGLEVRIATGSGDTLMRGTFAPVAFMDIWDRSQGGGGAGDVGAGAMYQSVLTHLNWGDVSRSPFLAGLRDAAGDGPLSIKFNVDGINLDFTSPEFTYGRIVGTIGPSSRAAPRHFVPGRQFMTVAKPGAGGFFTPAGGINICVGRVDHHTKKVYVDLGNALPTSSPGGPPVDLGVVSLYQSPPPQGNPGPILLGELTPATYTDEAWYATTAGVVAFPPDRPLTPSELAAVDGNPLVLALTPAGERARVAIAESPNGLFLRADQFVFRLNPGEEATARLHATRFGHPLRNAGVISIRYPDILQPGSPLGAAPPVATPEAAVEFPVRTVTDDHGVAELAIGAADPGRPRDYIDGQVYGIYPMLEQTIVGPTDPYPFNQWAFISLLVWSGFEADEPPTWHGSIHPILQQYANLYPVMDRFLDLGDYDSVCANLDLLRLAFGLHVVDPNSMPVTRDLSKAKRAAIQRWLAEVDESGKPRKGTPPVVAEPSLAEAPAAGAVGVKAVSPQQGGKASAAGRRLVVPGLPTPRALSALPGADA